MCCAAIFERLRTVLHESSIDKRVQYMIEVMFAVRKDGFKVSFSFHITDWDYKKGVLLSYCKGVVYPGCCILLVCVYNI